MSAVARDTGALRDTAEHERDATALDASVVRDTDEFEKDTAHDPSVLLDSSGICLARRKCPDLDLAVVAVAAW